MTKKRYSAMNAVRRYSPGRTSNRLRHTTLAFVLDISKPVYWTRNGRRSEPLRAAGTGVRASPVSEQDRASSEFRRGREGPARVDSRVLWLLRLALVRAWPLAVGTAGADRSESGVCPPCARGAGAQLDRGEYRWRGGVSESGRTRRLRASVRTGVAAATRRGTARVEGRGRAAMVGRAGAAGNPGCRTHQRMATEAHPSRAVGRAQPDRVRAGTDA